MPTKKSAPSGDASASPRPRRVKSKSDKPAAAMVPADGSGPAVPPRARVESSEIDAACDLTHVYGLFKLTDLEQRLVSALLQESGVASVDRLAARLNESIAAVLGLLGPQQQLRQAALVEVEPGAELGYPRPSEPIFLGRGLALASPKHDASPALLPGLAVLAAPSSDANWAAEFVADRAGQIVLELVKEKLVSTRPLLLYLSGCSADTAGLLAQAVRLRLSRPVFYLDGGGLSGWPQPDVAAALRRLRRDADLRGAALVVQDADLLGSAWRALVQPKPPGQTAPVILCSSGTLAAPKYPQTFSFGNPLWPHSHTLRPASTTTAATSGGAAAQAATSPEPEVSEVDRSREEARRQAAVDAAKAMGKPIPKELLSPVTTTPTPSVAATPPSAPPSAGPVAVQPTAVAAKTETSAPAAAKVEPAAAKVESAQAPVQPPASQPAARPMNPRLAAALAKAGLPLPPAGRPESTPAPVAQSVPAAPTTVAAAAASASPTPASVPAVVAPAVEPAAPALVVGAGDAAGSEGEVEGPPIPLADDAKLDDLINAAKTTTNLRQRAELLKRLAGTKSPVVIQLFRLFCASPHAAVRQAAEEGMASLFGANWNRARSIAPPVQPPRTDDGGRGPGGAF